MTKTDVKSSAWSVAFYQQVLQCLKYSLDDREHQLGWCAENKYVQQFC